MLLYKVEYDKVIYLVHLKMGNKDNYFKIPVDRNLYKRW